MKLTILGNRGPYPTPNGACSGYLLESEKTHILIECGTGVLAKMQHHIAFSQLDAVILSHLHYDHMSDMLPMQYALQFNPRDRLRVYAPETPANVRALLDVPCYVLRGMEDKQIGDMQIRYFPVRHPVESWAMRIECGGRVFVYTGDTNEVDGLADFARGADLLLADAGLSDADWGERSPHLSALGCGRLARAAEVKRLLLTHLNPKYDPKALENEARTVFENACFCVRGESYEI